MSAPTIFMLGATGFVGGYLVEQLAQQHPDFKLVCLVRDTTPGKISNLKALHPNIESVAGTLDDAEILSAQARKSDIVIHLAASDHPVSVDALLHGLTQRIEDRPGEPAPVYMHMSGLAALGDGARGEKREKLVEWTDVGFDIEDCPTNIYITSNRKIAAAGARADKPIRTIILFPGLIYGFGKNGSNSLFVTYMVKFARDAGHAGTWGPGEVRGDPIHIKDVSAAAVRVLDAVLDGKVQGGKDGIVFITSTEPAMTWKETTGIIGNIMYDKGLLKEPGSRPFSAEFTEPWGEDGWAQLGSNGHASSDQMTGLGWKPEWSKKESIQSLFPKMVEAALTKDV